MFNQRLGMKFFMIKNMGSLLVLCGLASSFVQCAQSQPAKYVIPGLRVPISFHKKDSTSKSSVMLQACCALTPHLYVSYMHNRGNGASLRAQILQHLFLHVGMNIVGLLTTIGHELGHAAIDKQLDFVTEGPDIKVFYSPLSLVSGMYTGKTDVTETVCPGIESLHKDKDRSSIVTTKEEYIAWAQRYQDRCAKSIINFVTGPIVGLVTAPALAYTLASIQPYVCDSSVSKVALIALLSGPAIAQNILNIYPWNKGYDGSKALHCWKAMQEVKQIEKEVLKFPNGTPVTLDFSDQK